MQTTLILQGKDNTGKLKQFRIPEAKAGMGRRYLEATFNQIIDDGTFVNANSPLEVIDAIKTAEE